jgi:hypothetical protein
VLSGLRDQGRESSAAAEQGALFENKNGRFDLSRVLIDKKLSAHSSGLPSEQQLCSQLNHAGSAATKARVGLGLVWSLRYEALLR